MSTNYSASQYNQEFAPKRMQMYEVPKAQLSKVIELDRGNSLNSGNLSLINKRNHLKEKAT